jgi:biopolymer transport protein ExbB/TolQ
VPVRVDLLTLDLVRRASTREASRVHQQLSRGIYTLAIIARTATWLGIFATCYGIGHAFDHPSGEASMGRAIVNEGLAEALLPTVFGIALLAAWIHKFLISRVERFDLEMHAAVLELPNILSRLRFLTN